MLYAFTLAPACNNFRYYDHSAITSRLFSQKRRLVIAINVKKIRYNEYYF